MRKEYDANEFDTFNANVNIGEQLITVDPKNAYDVALMAGLGGVLGIAMGKAIIMGVSGLISSVRYPKRKSSAEYTANANDYREVEPDNDFSEEKSN